MHVHVTFNTLIFVKKNELCEKGLLKTGSCVLGPSKDNWIVTSLVEYYCQTQSSRCLDLLLNVREPSDKVGLHSILCNFWFWHFSTITVWMGAGGGMDFSPKGHYSIDFSPPVVKKPAVRWWFLTKQDKNVAGELKKLNKATMRAPSLLVSRIELRCIGSQVYL